MIEPLQFSKYVIEPSLHAIGAYSKRAEALLLGTCAQESKLGYYIKQVGGPALGIFQMEPNTYDDIVKNYLSFRTSLTNDINDFCGYEILPTALRLISDLRLATIMARLTYLRAPNSLPLETDIKGMAAYWKKYYNTEMGKGNTEEFIYNYEKYVRPYI